MVLGFSHSLKGDDHGSRRINSSNELKDDTRSVSFHEMFIVEEIGGSTFDLECFRFSESVSVCRRVTVSTPNPDSVRLKFRTRKERLESSDGGTTPGTGREYLLSVISR